MPAFFMVFIRFARALWNGLKEPEFRALFVTVVVLLITGTFYYSRVEGWSRLDALYFTVITLTTVGYGDLSPTQPGSKIFTIVFIFIGLGVISTFIVLLAERASQQGGFLRRRRETKGESPNQGSTSGV